MYVLMIHKQGWNWPEVRLLETEKQVNERIDRFKAESLAYQFHYEEISLETENNA